MSENIFTSENDDVPLFAATFYHDHETDTNEYAPRAVLQTAGGILLRANSASDGFGLFRRAEVR